MGQIAFLFSGQCAQRPGMGLAWQGANPAATTVFKTAEALCPGVIALCVQADAETLNETVNAQPSLFCMDLAAALALCKAGVRADCVAGFSLGEVPALAFAGMLSLEAAFRLVCLRAQAMQDCARQHPGGMAAVLGLDNPAVERLCEGHADLYPANYNCPGQLVVSGSREALAAAAPEIRALGGRTLPLRTSGAFHTPFMRPAQQCLEEALDLLSLSNPALPVYSNVTAAPYAPPYAALLARQVTHPVRWQQTLEAMAAIGVDRFVEVGVGQTLVGLVRKTLPGARAYAVEDPQTLAAAVAALKEEG